jgi:hypothetical protein
MWEPSGTAVRVLGRAAQGDFHGPTGQWVEQITALVRDRGMNGFVYWPNQDYERQLAVFAREVVPAVRQALATP